MQIEYEKKQAAEIRRYGWVRISTEFSSLMRKSGEVFRPAFLRFLQASSRGGIKNRRPEQPGGGELRIALPKNGQKVLMTVLPVAGEM